MDLRSETHADRRRAVLSAEVEPSRRMNICDVGASAIGEAPYAGLLRDGLAHVYGFEPSPEQFTRLQEIKSEQETYFEAAVGAPGKRTLHIHPRPGFTSLFKMDAASMKAIGKEKLVSDRVEEVELTTVALDEVEDLPRVDVLKMDLQGGELEVLKGAEDRLSEAVAVVSEVRFHRIYEGEPMFGDIDVELRRQGFRLHKLLFTKSVMMPHDHEGAVVRKRMTSQLLDGDAVYVREADYSAEFSDDKLLFLLLAADAMFDSPDFVLHLMEVAVERGLLPKGLWRDYVARLRSHQQAGKEGGA
ncbi:MAG: FkbM family methyltransferase [Vannielia sp.]|uniref:FkbM family methyltransferase n=1 Tax=Vannielia sp. TaxID=2813045 RepID=UPI003B8CFB07